MLYDEHRTFVSTGSGNLAKAFREKEASFLKEGKFMEAFNLNASRLRAQYGNKYDKAIQEAREYYQEKVVPELQQQSAKKIGN